MSYESDTPHSIYDVKQGQVGSVLAWETSWKSQCCIFNFSFFMGGCSCSSISMISQDMIRIHHISSLNMIVGRVIYRMGVLDHPISFSIDMPMAMHLMMLHARTRGAVVTKLLRVSIMYLYRQCTKGLTNAPWTYHVWVILD